MKSDKVFCLQAARKKMVDREISGDLNRLNITLDRGDPGHIDAAQGAAPSVVSEEGWGQAGGRGRQ